jgi:NADH:ubiquinone oxidoreductase subunit K
MNNRNLVWPVTLIAVGVLFLAYNLGFLQFSQLKELISTWWPLILIAVGIGGLMQRKR